MESPDVTAMRNSEGLNSKDVGPLFDPSEEMEKLWICLPAMRSQIFRVPSILLQL
jgi:hypothetical protein